MVQAGRKDDLQAKGDRNSGSRLSWTGGDWDRNFKIKAGIKAQHSLGRAGEGGAKELSHLLTHKEN